MTNDSIERLSEVYAQAGYRRVDPDPFTSESFPDTFVMSALHDRIVAAASIPVGVGAVPLREFGAQSVFRHVDLEKVGYSGFHLSSFSMFVGYSVRSSTLASKEAKAEAAEAVVRALSFVGISAEALLVSVFGGGRVLDRTFDRDFEWMSAWEDVGLGTSQLVAMPGRSHFTNVRRGGEPAGPRCEVFATAGGRTVEVATAVCEQFLLDKDARSLRPSPNIVSGAAFGVERIHALATGAADVFRQGSLAIATELMDAYVGSIIVATRVSCVREAIDAVRTLVLLAEFIPTARGMRRQRLNRLRRITLSRLDELGVVEAQRCVAELVGVFARDTYLSGSADAVDVGLTVERFVFGDGVYGAS